MQINMYRIWELGFDSEGGYTETDLFGIIADKDSYLRHYFETRKHNAEFQQIRVETVGTVDLNRLL